MMYNGTCTWKKILSKRIYTKFLSFIAVLFIFKMLSLICCYAKDPFGGVLNGHTYKHRERKKELNYEHKKQ